MPLISPQEQARVALRVLAGQQTPEQAAQEHGVSIEEIASWGQLLKAGASLAATRKRRRLKAIGLLSAALLLVGITVSIAGPTPCPDTVPVLSTHLIKFCPDVAASGYDLSQNFSLVAFWISKKAGAVDQAVPGGLIKGNQIAASQITPTQLATPAVTDAVQLGTLGPGELADNTLVSGDFDPAALVKLYKHNQYCEGQDATKTTTTYSLSATCFPQECGVLCKTATGNYGLSVADCVDGCAKPVCHEATCEATNPKFCIPTAPFAACDNTLAGYLLAP